MKPQTVVPLMRTFPGLPLPSRATENVFGYFKDAQDFFKAWTGKTFKLSYPKRILSYQTVDEAVFEGGGMTKQGMVAFHNRGLINLWDETKLYVLLSFHPPDYDFDGGCYKREWWGAMPSYPQCSGAVGSAGWKPWAMAGIFPDQLVAQGWAAEWSMQGRIEEAPGQWRVFWPHTVRGGLTHEIGHALGLWGHTQDDPTTPEHEQSDSVMFFYRSASAGLLPSEIETILSLGGLG